MTRPLPQPVRIYRVGGSVRDELLGRPVRDHDWVVVGATPEIMLASGFLPVGKDFPVFLHPESRDEYALARTERKHGRGYRGFQFFATPDVTLEDDLERRDLTINAMARAPDGRLIDPHGGEADLRAGILRHVSPAFAEDPLRVLRVARFAARFGFAIAGDTLALMHDIVASGELVTLAPERIWQEISTGLLEAHPSRMLDALRACDALQAVMPEIDALYAIRIRTPGIASDDAGAFTERALERAAEHEAALPARYAVLAQELDRVAKKESPREPFDRRRGAARVGTLSKRLRVPLDCHAAALLALRWRRALLDPAAIAPAGWLDLLIGADALRRPERLEWLAAAADAHAAAASLRSVPRHTATLLREALGVVRGVDAAAIAREAIARAAGASQTAREARHGERIARALRAARLAALRAWKIRSGTRPRA